jgi:hypothetical protein
MMLSAYLVIKIAETRLLTTQLGCLRMVSGSINLSSLTGCDLVVIWNF